jgi:hypothetical protein
MMISLLLIILFLSTSILSASYFDRPQEKYEEAMIHPSKAIVSLEFEVQKGRRWWPHLASSPLATKSNVTTLNETVVFARLDEQRNYLEEIRALVGTVTNYTHKLLSRRGVRRRRELCTSLIKVLYYTRDHGFCAGDSHTRWSTLCALAEARALGRVYVFDPFWCVAGEHRRDVRDRSSAFAMPVGLHDDVERLQSEPAIGADEYEALCPSALYRSESVHWTVASQRGNDAGVVGSANPFVDTAALDERFGDVALLVRDQWRTDTTGPVYWYAVCKRQEPLLQRRYSALGPPRRLRWLADEIAKRIGDEAASANLSVAAVHVRRGDKARVVAKFTTLARETEPDAVCAGVRRSLSAAAPCDRSTLLFVAAEEPPSFYRVPPLSSCFRVAMTLDHVARVRAALHIAPGAELPPTVHCAIDELVAHRLGWLSPLSRVIETFNELTCLDRAAGAATLLSNCTTPLHIDNVKFHCQ